MKPPSVCRVCAPSPVRLFDFHPLHRFWFVGSVQQLFPDDWPVLLSDSQSSSTVIPSIPGATFIGLHPP